MKCCVPGCKSRSEAASPELSFHRFPKDSGMKKRWIEALRRPETWSPSKWSLVCGLHFSPADFKADVTGLHRLTTKAVPSLSHIQSLARETLSRGQETFYVGLQPSYEPLRLQVVYLMEARGTAERAGPSDTAVAAAATATEERASSSHMLVEEDVKVEEAPVELLETAQHASSGPDSVNKESQVHAATIMHHEYCRSELPIKHQQSDHEATMTGPGHGDETAEATAGLSLQTVVVAATSPTSNEGMPHAARDPPGKACPLCGVRRYAATDVSSRKKIRGLQQTQRRLKRKVAHLQDVIKDLSKTRIPTDENVPTLQSLAGSKENLLHEMLKQSGGPYPKAYSPKLREFALTLYSCSPKAYEYVRTVFHMSLPHPKTLSKW